MALETHEPTPFVLRKKLMVEWRERAPASAADGKFIDDQAGNSGIRIRIMKIQNIETGETFAAWELGISNEYGRSMALVKGVSPKELQNLVKAGYRSTGKGMKLQFEVLHGDNVTIGKSGDYLQRNNEGILEIVPQIEFEKTYKVVE